MSENDLSKKIRDLRAKHGLTLEQVAQQVGVGKSTVRKWETGFIENMRRDKIAKLAMALHTTPDYLMGWSDTTQTPDVTVPTFNLSAAEQELIRKFRQLDDRGKAAVMNSLDHEYGALSQEDAHNVLRIAARDGSYQEVTLTDQQAADLQTLLDQLPDVPKGL